MCVCVFVCVCVQGEVYGRVEMAGSILCMSYCCWLGFFFFVCQCYVHCPGKQHHNRIILSKKDVAKVSIRVCNICKGWDGLTGNVLCRCPPCSCLCANADVQERNRQEQKFQEQRLQKKLNSFFSFNLIKIDSIHMYHL